VIYYTFEVNNPSEAKEKLQTILHKDFGDREYCIVSETYHYHAEQTYFMPTPSYYTVNFEVKLIDGR